MTIETTVVGSYPKPPDEGRPFTLRKTLHGIESGAKTEEDLRRAFEELAAEVIKEQEDAGVDLITDGHVRWEDILTPFARVFAGFEIGGLLRWFDNNVYYRRPICVGPVDWAGPSSLDGFKFAHSVATKPVKAVIPGPVSFARLSIDEHYGDHEKFVEALARVLAQEAFELAAAGAAHIQIDEPALLQAPEDLALARRALDLVIAELKDVEVTLATYFGDAKRLGAELFDLPASVFALDFIAGPENEQLIADLPQGKKLQAGIVDARNTRLEDTTELTQTIDNLAAQLGAERLRVAPSAGLEFLPREKARAKLQRLGEAAQKVSAK
ncbi:MAG: methylcobamide--CoM methyltransferase [Actinomycetota bacterium]